jgi:phosphoglycolate phosphatase
MRPFDTAIFDMDGTLVDTLKMTVGAFDELSEGFGLPRVPDERIRAAMGLPEPQFYWKIFPDEDRETLRAFGRAVAAWEDECARALGPDVLFPGVREMLDALKAEGFHLCIASTGSESHVTTSLIAGGIHGLFDCVACGSADKGAMVARLIEGRDPARCFIAGDTRIDAAAGRSADIPTFGAGFGYLDPAEYALFDRVFETPGALTREVIGRGAGAPG